MDTKILSILLSLLNKKKSCRLKSRFAEKIMKTIKTLFPFIAALGVFFLASNSEMKKKNESISLN